MAAVLLLWGRLAGAQANPADSLAIRLRRAEAAIETLQKQLAEQAESSVRTRSGAKLEFTGRVVMTAFANSRTVNNVDDPQFVQPDPPVRGIGMTARQTQLGLVLTIPEALGGSFSGDLDIDFGGDVPAGGTRNFPSPRLRTARGFLRWPHIELMVGQESPLISRLNPVSPAAIITPDFATAGNLWMWLPQVRLGYERGEAIRFGVQGAVVAPRSGDGLPNAERYDTAEASGRPYFQGRVYARWGNEMQREIGCGLHRGWLRGASEAVATQTGVKEVQETNAFGCDAQLPIFEWLELRGEMFGGSGTRGLGGGGISQNFQLTSSTVPPIRLQTMGGWVQVNARPVHSIRAGVGVGTDQPHQSAARIRNDALAAYTIWRPSDGPLFVGAEARVLRTEWTVGLTRADVPRHTNHNVTLTFGFEF